MNALRREIELLLLSASPATDSQRDSRMFELLDAGLDWKYLQDLAESHRLTQLLYWRMKTLRPEVIPAELACRFHANTRNNLFRTRELLRVLDLFEVRNIPAIPFKGPTLAVQAYHNLALRTFDDLDIMVRPSDVWKARDLLLADGYQTSLRLRASLQDAYLHSYDEYVFSSDEESLLVELHWAFVPPHFSVALDTEPLWNRRDKVLLGNREVLGLGGEDMALALCLHGSKHCWSHLGLVCDIAWLISGNAMDWDILLGVAGKLGAQRMVLLGACLATRLFETPLPEPVAQAASLDPAVSRLAAAITRSLFGKRHDEGDILRSGLLHMKMRERPGDRLRYGFRLATRPAIEDWQSVDLPRPLRPLYRLVRFPRLIWKYAWGRSRPRQPGS